MPQFVMQKTPLHQLKENATPTLFQEYAHPAQLFQNGYSKETLILLCDPETNLFPFAVSVNLSACDAQAGRRAIRGSVVDSLIPVML